MKAKRNVPEAGWYHLICTVNSPTEEYVYETESRDLNATLERIKVQHPSMTSVVMVIVPCD